MFALASSHCLFVLPLGDDGESTALLPLIGGGPTSPSPTNIGGSGNGDGGSGGGGNGGPGGGSPGPALFTLQVTVSGLTGSGLILQDHNNVELAVSGDGGYTFPVPRADGESYRIEVKQRPSGPGQYCRVKSGEGRISGTNAFVEIDCMNSLRMLGNINHKAIVLPDINQIISSNSEIFFVGTDSDREYNRKIWSLRGTEPYPIPEFYSADDYRASFSQINFFKEKNGTVFFSAKPGRYAQAVFAASSARDSLEYLGETSKVSIKDSAFTSDNRLMFMRKVDSLNVELVSYRDGSREALRTFTSGYTLSYPTQPELRHLTNMNGVVYFQVQSFIWEESRLWSTDLWRTDGTAAGTYLLRKMRLINNSRFARLGDELYFIGVDEMPGAQRALWKTDGTIAGTVSVRNLPTNPENLTASGNKLYFTSSGNTASTKKIWVSDGTAVGTREVAETQLTSDPSFHPYKGGIYFLHPAGGANGLQLVHCDETGITVVKNDLFGNQTTNYYREDFRVANGLLFFLLSRSYSSFSNNEIWRTDGTTTGTFRLGTNLNPGNRIVPYQSGVAFSGYDSANPSIWYSDGTQAGTTKLFSNYKGANSHPSTAAKLGDLTFFIANDGAIGREPWITDGTTEGTGLLRDVAPGNYSDHLLPTNAGSRLFFFAKLSFSRVRQLWVTDGTPAGTQPIQTFNLRNSPYAFVTFALANGADLFFALDHETFGNELWFSDGTTAGTRLVVDMQPGTQSSSPVPLGILNSRLIFSAASPTYGRELWITDSSASGAVLLKDINPSGQWSRPVLTAATADTIYFTAWAPGTGKELWKTDGTTAGTVLVKDISPGDASTEVSTALIIDSKLFFVAETAGHGKELWVSDGTSAGTRLLKDIAIGADDSDPDHLTAFKGVLYFTATNADNGREVWRSDGTETGTIILKDIRPGNYGSQPKQLTVAGNYLYFSAHTGTGTELWITDGSEPGTMLLRDIRPGTQSSLPSLLTAVGDKLLFTARAGTDDGLELWQSDGTPDGTFRVSDLWPGPVDSDPQILATTPDGILFSADDGVHGRELWMYNP